MNFFKNQNIRTKFTTLTVLGIVVIIGTLGYTTVQYLLQQRDVKNLELLNVQYVALETLGRRFLQINYLREAEGDSFDIENLERETQSYVQLLKDSTSSP